MLAGGAASAGPTVRRLTFPTTFSAQVKGLRPGHPDSATPSEHRHAGRHVRFALAAAAQAWKQSGLAGRHGLDRTRLGIYLGSGEGSLDFDNFTALPGRRLARTDKLDTLKLGPAGLRSGWTCTASWSRKPTWWLATWPAEFGVRGPAFNVLTACAASTQAIGEAAMLIRRGDADVIISGGAHSMIHPFGVTGSTA